MLYTAIVRDEVILSEPTLAAVLALVADLRDLDRPEDVVVWAGYRVVAVVHPDGRLTTPQAAVAAA